MKKIETEVNINSSIESVWEIISDLGCHSDWNPFLTKIDGNLIEGSSVRITVQLGNNKPEIAEPILKKLIPKKEIHFLMNKWPLIKGEHYFIFESISDTETKFIHGERFYGLLPMFLWWKLKPLFTQGFNDMNQALKNRVEFRHNKFSQSDAR